MMLETVAIIVAITAAATFAGWRAYRTLQVAKGTKPCGGCEKCE